MVTVRYCSLFSAFCTFLLVNLTCGEHRSNLRLKTANYGNIIFALEECFVNYRCGTILSTVKQNCAISKLSDEECIWDRHGDGSCRELLRQIKSTAITKQEFCREKHKRNSSLHQKYKLCYKVNKFIRGKGCGDDNYLSPSITSNRVNTRTSNKSKKEHGYGRRLYSDHRFGRQAANSIRLAAAGSNDQATKQTSGGDGGGESAKDQNSSMKEVAKIVAEIIADKDGANKAKPVSKNSPKGTVSTKVPATEPVIKTTTIRPHHIPGGFELYVGIFIAAFLMLIIFALVLCKSRSTDNVISQIYTKGNNSNTAASEQQPMSERSKKNDYDAIQEVHG